MTTNLLLILILLVLMHQAYRKPRPAGGISDSIAWEIQRLAVQAGNVARLIAGGPRHA